MIQHVDEKHGAPASRLTFAQIPQIDGSPQAFADGCADIIADTLTPPRVGPDPLAHERDRTTSHRP